ncbi:MAG: 1-phosphofructokinase family hexose kinase [Solirubrobacterales bacterium]|nr:1-phosphofructokinase family hexose kinase [Solirubrobacterales bacterium]MCB8970655.1 1-phosphofructokinase family hexose kinase [Thermoleophilales bacterium]MCO5326445.1 1-phosphofructokinase family hexose kinase [Solirubrobacterales bacterium]
MILTVTLNVALDRTVAVPRIALGNRHRAIDARVTAGGKGVNVARALKSLGEPVIAAGLAAGPTGVRIRELLGDEQVLYDFTEVAGDSRTNLSIVDPASGEQTEINERGPQVTAEDLERFTDRLVYLAGGADFCVIAGSLPPGAEADAYAELISRLREVGVPVLLDTAGDPMRAGMRAQPAVVAPNVAEAEEAVGYEFTEPEDLFSALATLVEMGAEEAIITTESGCVALAGGPHSRTRIEATIEPLPTVASIGSGDAFLAGYVKSRRAGLSPQGCLAYGVACGAESTQHLGAGTLDANEVGRLVDLIAVSSTPAPAGVV